MIKEKFFHYDQDNETSYLVIDTVNLVLNELETARKLYNTNKDYFFTLMKEFSVLELQFRKAPLKKRIDYLDIGSIDWSYDDTSEKIMIRTAMVDGQFEERNEMRFFSRQYNVNPNTLVEAQNTSFDITTKSTFDASTKIGYIKQLPSNELYLYNLMAVDELYYQDNAEDYRLKITLDFADSFRTELVKSRNALLTIVSELELVYTGFFGKKDKTTIINFFSDNGIALDNDLNFLRISSEALFENGIFKRTQVATYRVLLAVLGDNKVIDGVLKNTVKNLYINTKSKESINSVIEFLRNLIIRFNKMYNLGSTNSDSVISRSKVVKVEKIIDKIITTENPREGAFNFIEKSMNKRILTPQEIIARADAEYNKFFSRQIGAAEITSISGDISQNTAKQMVDFEHKKYAFFTPTSYKTADNTIDLANADISIFDEKKHDIISNHMFDVKNRTKRLRRGGKAKARMTLDSRRGLKKKKLLSTIGITRPFKKSTAAGDDSKFEDAKEYLGSTSLFLSTNLGTRRKNIEPSKGPPNLIMKCFAQDKKIRKFKFISLDNEESYILKNKNNVDFSELPMQFRALVLSNYGLSRFSFPLEEEQLIENPRFSVALNNIFNRIKIAEYIDGFETNELGLRKLNSPIYRALDLEALNSGKTLMVRLKKYSNGILELEEEDDMPSTNTSFCIEGNIQPVLLEPDLPDIPDPSQRQIQEYSTTNIIKQNDKRKQLTNFVNSEPNTPAMQPTPQRRSNTINQASSIRPTRGNY
jgi:hypothetical protein